MDRDAQRVELIKTILQLPDEQLSIAANMLRMAQLQSTTISPYALAESHSAMAKDWPHAPRHSVAAQGAYMVTTGTYRKAHVFDTAERLTLLENNLLTTARRYEWNLEAWAVFSNHYHFVGYSLKSPNRLREFLTELHATTAREVNKADGEAGRQVWHNYWEKELTFQKSYLARLNYVHQNAVKHGLVRVANQYPWCSAAWLERTVRPAQVKMIYSFKIDSLKVSDEFDPLVIIPS